MKITKKSDFAKWLKINRSLLPVKLHYFIFFTALAAVLPFRTVFAKQLGVSATAVGVIFTAVPFIKLITNPLFGAILDHFKRFRLTLTIIMLVVAASHLSIVFIPQLQSRQMMHINVSCNSIFEPHSHQCFLTASVPHLCQLHCHLCLKNESHGESEISEICYPNCDQQNGVHVSFNISLLRIISRNGTGSSSLIESLLSTEVNISQLCPCVGSMLCYIENDCNPEVVSCLQKESIHREKVFLNHSGEDEKLIFNHSGEDGKLIFNHNGEDGKLIFNHNGEDGKLIFNQSGEDGNLIFNQSGEDGKLIFNHSGDDGKLIFHQSGEDGKLIFNQSGEDGKLIFNHSGEDGKLIFNQSGEDGKLIFNQSGEDGKLICNHSGEDGKLILNHSGEDGKLIFNHSGEDGKLIFNHSGEDGKLIFNHSGGDEEVFLTLQFWLLLLLMSISSVSFSAVLFLMDAICYEILDDKPDKYGQQRLWGTIGWGIGALAGGYLNQIFSEDSTTINYAPGFYLLVILTLVDLLPLLRIKVTNIRYSKHIFKDVGMLFSQLYVFIYISMVFFIGILSGLIWNYQFWFLEEIGASQLLLGLSQTVECFLAELPCFIVAGAIIRKIGHMNCVTLTFAFFAARYLWFAYMENPWYSLPAGFLHGPTFGLFFASMTMFAKTEAPPGTEATVQALLAVLFEGVGAAIGSILGGIGFDTFGSRATFFYTAEASLVLTFISGSLHLLLIYKRRRKKKTVFPVKKELPPKQSTTL